MKIKLSHFFHPLRTTNIICKLAQKRIKRYIAEKELQQHIKRGKRDRCWCGGELYILSELLSGLEYVQN